MKIIDGLIQHHIKFANYIRNEVDIIVNTSQEKSSEDVSSYSEANYKLCASGLALLYKLNHPKNLLYSQEWLKESAIKLLDVFLKDVEFQADGTATLKAIGSEWLAYTVTQVTKTLENELDEMRKRKAFAYIEAYAHHAFEEPMFFTAYNHECWRCWTLYNAGLYFHKPEWCERALFFIEQLLEFQTPEGFWEESKHHGPSMKYNQLMLQPLGWLSRLTGNEKIKKSTERLSAFMAKWSFPDGTTVGSFDGRQSTSLMYFSPVCPGLEFTQEGAELNRRGIELWEARGNLTEERALGNSNWYAHFSTFSITDALHYFLKYPSAEKKGSLPIDVTDASLENHSTEFDGVLKRWGSWVLAASSQNSDIPRALPSVFRLDRQSRLELWHSACGVVLGGGHHITSWDTPYANVILSTKEYELKTDFAWVEPSKKRGGRACKAYYVPRLVRSKIVDDKVVLDLIFGHANFTFISSPISQEEFKIEVKWQGRDIKKMYLQIPMLLWRKGEMFVDGKLIDGCIQGLTHTIQKAVFKDSIKNTEVTITPPKGYSTKIRTGLSQIRSYGNLFAEEHFDPPYYINMVSTELVKPNDSGSAEWVILLKK